MSVIIIIVSLENLPKTSLSNILLNFQIVENINSRSVENYKKNKIKKEKPGILFIDGNYKHQDALIREGKNILTNKKKYIESVRKYLKYLGEIFDLNISIALHPSSNLKEYKKLFPKFKIKKYNTLEQIYNSSIVIFHESSSVIDAFLAKKDNCFSNKNVGKLYF